MGKKLTEKCCSFNVCCLICWICFAFCLAFGGLLIAIIWSKAFSPEDTLNITFLLSIIILAILFLSTLICWIVWCLKLKKNKTENGRIERIENQVNKVDKDIKEIIKLNIEALQSTRKLSNSNKNQEQPPKEKD